MSERSERMLEFFMDSTFLASWKALDKRCIHVIFLDFLYYTILLFAGSFWVYKVLPTFLQLTKAAELLKGVGGEFFSVESFTEEIESLGMQWNEVLLYTTLIALLLFANYCLFKYLIWLKIQGKHQKGKQLLKSLCYFALLNGAVLLLDVAVLFVSYNIFVLETFNVLFYFVIPLIAIYSLNLLHLLFAMTQSLKQTVQEYGRIGIRHVHLFIIPYLIMLLGVFIMIFFQKLPLTVIEYGQMTGVYDQSVSLQALYFTWYCLLIAAYFTWTKYYLWELIKKIKAKIK